MSSPSSSLTSSWAFNTNSTKSDQDDYHQPYRLYSNLVADFKYLKKFNANLKHEEQQIQTNNISKFPFRGILYEKDILFKYLIPNYKMLSQYLVEIGNLITNVKHHIKSENYTIEKENKDALNRLINLLHTKVELEKVMVTLTSSSQLLYTNRFLLFNFLSRPTKLSKKISELRKQNTPKKDELASNPDEKNKSEPSSPNMVIFAEVFSALSNPEYQSNTAANLQFQSIQSIRKFKEYILCENLIEFSASFETLVNLILTLRNEIIPALNVAFDENYLLFAELYILLFHDFLFNLSLVRNLVIEQDETRLTTSINYLFSETLRLDYLLIKLINGMTLNTNRKNEDTQNYSFILYSLIFQFFSLIFTKINESPHTTPASTRTNSKNMPNNKMELEVSSESSEAYKILENHCKNKLHDFAISLCHSSAFANLFNNMIQLINKSLDPNNYFDVGYFLWFVKFMIKHFVLKYHPCTAECSYLQSMTDCNSASQRKKNQKIVFLNNTDCQASILTKDYLLSYDLISFVVFKMFENFEYLIFDSNSKSISLMFKYRIKEHIFCQERLENNHRSTSAKNSTDSKEIKCQNQTEKTSVKEKNTSKKEQTKLTNTHYLRILFLSISCLQELLDCIYQHSQYFLEMAEEHCKQDNDFLIFLNEFFNFDDLKQSFAFLLRFFCYNPHVYSNSLIRAIMLTNHQLLKTYQIVFLQIKKMTLRERDAHDQLDLSTNATKNSSTISSLNLKTLGWNRIYSLYCNADTSFILRHILVRFAENDPVVNRCCIELLDSLLSECEHVERLFHVDLTLALASIATTENFRGLDQRTKDVISNMLCEIRRLCKRKPCKANKILFDMHQLDEGKGGPSHKRFKADNTLSSEASSNNGVYSTDSLNYKSLNSTTVSSWSSLRSTSSFSPSNPTSSANTSGTLASARFSTNAFSNETPISYTVKLMIENEFLFCLRSLDAFNKTNRSDPNQMRNFIIKKDHLHRIFNYLVELFDSAHYLPGNKLSSWQIYQALLDMRFDMNDKIMYVHEINASKARGGHFKRGVSISFGNNLEIKNEFLKSKECINMRMAISNNEFRHQLKEAYIKFLIEKLSIKSKRTKQGLLWIFNQLRCLKVYVIKRNNTAFMGDNKNSTDSGISSLLLSSTRPSSLFNQKLISYYYLYQMGVSMIPFKIETQQVFHSVDFSHLLELLGFTKTNARFPTVPNEWLDPNNKSNLSECLNIMEKCLCI